MVEVPGGEYVALQPAKDELPVRVESFWLDVTAVTNAQFLEFVREAPSWRRSQASPLFVDPGYLGSWRGDLELGPEAPEDRPVTFVSWFAAAAYCRARGGRLPSEAEWERAAAPPAEDEARRAETARRTLAFYARPRGGLPRVGSTPPNAYGLRDLHGVIWEWVDDFNASLAGTDSRGQGDRELDSLCGGGAIGARDPTDYASFMRVAFRTSLQASYTLHHLGFRCARSIP